MLNENSSRSRIKVEIQSNPNSSLVFRKHISFILNSNGACPYGKAELCFLRIILFDDDQEWVEFYWPQQATVTLEMDDVDRSAGDKIRFWAFLDDNTLYVGFQFSIENLNGKLTIIWIRAFGAWKPYPYLNRKKINRCHQHFCR